MSKISRIRVQHQKPNENYVKKVKKLKAETFTE